MLTDIQPKNKRARYWFDSLAELARYLEDAPRTWKANSSTSYPSYRDRWDLGAGYASARNLAEFGWIEGAQRTQEALKGLAPATPAPDSVTDFYGHRPHVARYCAGAPDSMIRHTPNPRDGYGRVIALMVQVNANASNDAKHMANYGVALAHYINQLESEGLRCEVIGVITSEVVKWRVSHCWRVKRADQPLDLAVMAFAIGHPAMFRRLGFALRERCAAPESSAYGQSVGARVEDCMNAPAGAIVLDGMTRASEIARTADNALKYIEAQIEKALDRPNG